MFHFASSDGRVPVKFEIEDPLEDSHGPVVKKQKQYSDSVQTISQNNTFAITPPQYNPLDEPSPLGLRLRKTPSLLDLIQMRLSRETSTHGSLPSDNFKPQEKIKPKAGATSGCIDKLKASNFPAALLRIGSWEYVSRYEGDLVAKCYFAKHKLVWEVLKGGLKSKIEIQWSDIMGLKADIPDDAPATLVVVLARQPIFFRETNPQPRKHTLWQASTDFTDGQATLHRKHFLQVPHGLLNKHFEKLIQCDMRLNSLSRQPEIAMESPYFESQPSAFHNSNEPETLGFDKRQPSKGLTFSIFEDIARPSGSQSSSITIKHEDFSHGIAEIMSRETPSPSSVINMPVIEERTSCESDKPKESKSFEQKIMKGLRPSMSMLDLVNHIENCISEETKTENLTFTKEGLEESRKKLEDIAQHLFSDFQFTQCSDSDEKSLMSRVNSLCSLLQKDGPPVQTFKEPEEVKNNSKNDSYNNNGGARDAASSCKQSPGMQRIDSYGELLLHLPRIASLPKFLFDISEDRDD